MEEAQTGKEGLIKGIERDAQVEAEKILEDRRRAVAGQAKGIIAQAEKRAEEQVQAINRSTSSSVGVETRKVSLKVREQILKETLEQVRRKMESLIGSEGYRRTLVGWIVEAAIGLNVPEAELNASKQEMPLLDRNLLDEAEKELKGLTGRSVKLTVSEEDPPLAQGVVLKAKDGRLAFNNQLQARLLRYDLQIRRIVYQKFFQG